MFNVKLVLYMRRCQAYVSAAASGSLQADLHFFLGSCFDAVESTGSQIHSFTFHTLV